MWGTTNHPDFNHSPWPMMDMSAWTRQPADLGLMTHWQSMWLAWLANMQQHPEQLQKVWTLFEGYLRAMNETACEEFAQASGHSRRFKDDSWDNGPFQALTNHYLGFAKATHEFIDATTEGNDTLRPLNFLMHQWVESLSPANHFWTNPEVLQLTIQTQGQNLFQGLMNFTQDFMRADGTVNIKMTDLDAFKVGENLAVTEGQVIFENELMQLIQYSPQTKEVFEVPLLVIPPWINKFYILDLQPKNSFVNWAVAQGFTVYLISWRNPDESHRDIGFDEYAELGPLAALDAMEKINGHQQCNALGFCLGGTLLGALMSVLAEKKDKRIQSATFLTTLLDFSEPGDIKAFIDDNQVSAIEQRMQQKGYLDGRDLMFTFNLLRVNELFWQTYVNHYLKGEAPKPFDLLYWNSDPTNLPAKMHSEYLRNMYLENRLIQPGAFKLLGTSVDLSKIKVPSYFFSAEADHIAPWQTTYNGAKAFSGPTTFVLGGSGHIAGVINPPQKNKYHYQVASLKQLPEQTDAWLAKSKQHQGSWWGHWAQWLSQHSGEKQAAQPLGEHLMPAPGSYVKASLYTRPKTMPNALDAWSSLGAMNPLWTNWWAMLGNPQALMPQPMATKPPSDKA